MVPLAPVRHRGGGGGGRLVVVFQAGKGTGVRLPDRPVAPGHLTESVTANGAINAVTNVQVGSQIPLRDLLDIKVDYNSQVKENDLIAQIDPSTYQRNVASSKAADLLNSRPPSNWPRSTPAAPSPAKRPPDPRRGRRHRRGRVPSGGRDGENEARPPWSGTRWIPPRTTIYAPINGIVISRNVDIGQTVAASFNTPTLFLIANDLHKMQIEAWSPRPSRRRGGWSTRGLQCGRLFRAQVRRDGAAGPLRAGYQPERGQLHHDRQRQQCRLEAAAGHDGQCLIITAEHTECSARAERRPALPSAGKGSGDHQCRCRGRAGGHQHAVAKPTDNEPPTPPWVAEGRRPSGREEIDKYTASLTPEQREVFERRRQERMRRGVAAAARAAVPAADAVLAAAARGAPRAGSSDAPATRMVYVIEKDKVGDKTRTRLKPVTVKTGITDGAYTEVVSGLSESDAVVTGLNTPLPATALGPAPSPFGGPPGGGFRPR